MIKDNLMNSFDVYNLTYEKKKLQASYEKLVEDSNGLLDAQERRHKYKGKMLKATSCTRTKIERKRNLEASASELSHVIRNMKLKLAHERKNLQIHIDELEKTVEESNVKMERIKAIING
ncbi:hypothetical protein ZWY2020_041114 [Hordeum vulgare]|nr:hypothetical protein ZWY2020_041114 [Hordeum vulgare]